MGRTLYEKEKVFRESVGETGQLIRNAGLPGILPHFEGTAAPDFLSDGSRDYTVTVAVQMAFTDLWRSRGVYPAAALGQSLGEAAALYAAGGLGKAEVVRIAGAMALSRLPSEYVLLHVQADMRHSVFRNSPVFLFPTYEAGNGESIAVCHQSKLTEAGNYLDQSGISWHQFADAHFSPIHTPLLLEKLPFFQSMLQGVTPQPLGCDYYSCALARKLPQYSLVPFDFFEKLLVTPVQMHDTVKEALKGSFQVALNISSHSFIGSSVQKAAGDAAVKVKVLHSLEEGQPEKAQFQRAFREWKKSSQFNFAKPGPSGPSPGDSSFQAFIGQFGSREAMDPSEWLAILSYMRAHGSIHFIPRLSSWLVLDFETAEAVFPDTELFSNQPYHDFDSSLLGTNPPGHTEVRGMLQPLYAPKSIKYLDDFIPQAIDRLFESVSQLPEFDLVKQVCRPLTMQMNGMMLGVPEEDFYRIPSDLHTPQAERGKALQFFQEFIARHDDYREYSGMARVLLELASNEKMSFQQVAALMKLLWNAGSVITYVLMCKLAQVLMTRRDLKNQLVDDPALILRFVEECLRLYPPAPFSPRLAKRDIILKDKSIPAGSIVIVSSMSANRDPSVFPNPDAILLDRPARRHFAFGMGAHHCLGSNISRILASHFVKAFLSRVDRLESSPLSPPQFICTLEFTDALSMPVCWKKEP
jgi:cytochrome P450